MLYDVIRAVPAAVLVGVAPGYFWAACLCVTTDRAERLAYATGLSITLVPAAALIPARLFGTGVTLRVAAFSALAVFLTGLAAYLMFDPAGEPDEPVLPEPAPPGAAALALLVVAFGLALPAVLGFLDESRVMLPVFLLMLFAGVVYLVESRRAAPRETSGEAPRPWARWFRRLLLPAVLLLTLLRGYLGPVLYDWPFLRGTDQFSHAVMAQEMLSKGAYETYLTYPPGFATLTALVCRLGGLDPLEVFPALAPALLVLPSLALYALARRLWGWEYGLTAAAFSGLVLGGTYANIAEARYPNLVAAQFLLVLAVAALTTLYRSPSVRGGLLLAVLGSSVVLYHQVASLYLALLLALVGLLVLPCLLLRHRKSGLVLLSSLALLFVLSVLYAWDTYDLPEVVAGLFSGSETGAVGESVAITIGSQPALGLAHLLATITAPVLWLGVLGALLLVGSRSLSATSVPLLLWGALLFAGSRTALSGFPQRFERDLGVPLALLAALAFVTVLRSLSSRHCGKTTTLVAMSLAVVGASLAGLLVGVQAWRNLEEAAAPSDAALLTPELAAAGEWLKENNEGGNIVTPPYLERLPNRAALALGGYTGLQSYTDERIRNPRSLPTAGIESLKDARWVLFHPGGERTRRILKERDVRYVFLDKGNPVVDWRSFGERPDLYHVAFENDAAVIFEVREG